MVPTPVSVHDLSDFQPFEGAANRTAVFVVGKTRTDFKYPVQYVLWTKKDAGEISQDDSFGKVCSETRRETFAAEPVDPNDRTSPWLTTGPAVLHALGRLRGKSDYVARKGVYCPTNAVYWITDAKPIAKGKVLITNLADTGKTKVRQVTKAVEDDFVYPLLRGKDVSRWHWSAKMSIILPQDRQNPAKAIPEADLRRHFPETFEYFKQYEEDLRGCALLEQFFDPKSDPFYSSYNVGNYTFQRHKVVWKEISSEVEAAVIDSENRSLIPDHKLVMVGFDSNEAAHFFCSVINSSPIRVLVRAYAVQTSISGHVCEYATLPLYSSKDASHKKLADLSRQCHAAAAKGDAKRVTSLEAEIDQAVANLWGVTEEELAAIHKALPKTEGKRRRASFRKEDE